MYDIRKLVKENKTYGYKSHLYFYTGHSGAGKSAKFIDIYETLMEKGKFLDYEVSKDNVYITKGFPSHCPIDSKDINDTNSTYIYSRNGKSIECYYYYDFLENYSDKIMSNTERKCILIDSCHHVPFNYFKELLSLFGEDDIVICFGMRDYFNKINDYNVDTRTLQYIMYYADDITIIPGGEEPFYIAPINVKFDAYDIL